ncbi:MAG: helix-turn-helix domain-containing protein [Minisyncoccia bacterium]
MESTFRSQLEETGLTKDQAALYDTLLRSGPLTARKATTASGVGRTLGYVVLDQLMTLGLVSKTEGKGSVTLFSPLHPNALQGRIESSKKQAQRSAVALQEALPGLASAFNLSVGRPGIRFFEGKEGLKEVLNDSLLSKTEIRAYVDNESIRQYIPDLNASYVKSRARLGIKRLNIATDTQENRFAIEGFLPKLTEWRLVPWEASPINTIVQMYDGKISYFTLGTEHLIGIIITDPHIYEFHRRQFDYLWNSPAVYAWPEEKKVHERDGSRFA